MTPAEADRTPAWGRSVQHFLRAAVGPGEPGTTDGELLARFIQAREQAAFELLVWRHGGMVLRAAKGIVRDHHLAEDVTQAVFLVLAKRAATLREPDALVGWLHITAQRLALRAVKRRRPTVALPELAAAAEVTHDAAVEEEVARLPEKYRLPVLLCFYEGLTHEEAAARLGRPVGTIAGWLARAKVRLHDRLIRRGFPLPACGLVPLLAVERVEATLVDSVLAGLGSSTVLSPTVSFLVIGAIRDMTILKLKFAAAAALAAAGLGLGGWVTVTAQQGGNPAAEKGKTPAAQNPPLRGILAIPALDPPAKPVNPLTLTQSRRSLANLKAIMIGFYNHHDTYGQFPKNWYDDKTAVPHLSWRVTILPYIGQEKLYKEFKLDEPWDSEHNLKLLAKMPDVYRVGIEAKDATHTYYQIVDTPGTAFVAKKLVNAFGGGFPGGTAGDLGAGGSPAAEGKSPPGSGGGGIPVPPVRIRSGVKAWEIIDGTSNTIGVMECGPAVPWTKPADLTGYTFGKALPAHWAYPFGSALHFATADGTALAFKIDYIHSGLMDPMLTADAGDDAGERISDQYWIRRKFQLRIPATSADDKAQLDKLKVDNAAKRKAFEAAMKLHLETIAKLSDGMQDFFSEEELGTKLDELLHDLERRKQPEKK